MRSRARDLLVLIDAGRRTGKAVRALTFVPPLRVRAFPAPPDPGDLEEEPLVYLLGETPALAGSDALLEWLEELRSNDAAPVALLLPRSGNEWCPATTHSQFCGLLPCDPDIRVESMERILHQARQNLARRFGQGTVRQAAFTWTFSTREAADPEQAWLLLESVLSSIVGPSVDLSCLGMAFAEALTNAVEHGNLELLSSLKDGSDVGFLRFLEERERRLTDPEYGGRTIRVAVELKGSRLRVRVRNEGRGFDPVVHSGVLAGLGSPGANPYGLGLAMMRSLVDGIRISSDGRTITLTHTIPRERLAVMGRNPTLLDLDRDGRRAA